MKDPTNPNLTYRKLKFTFIILFLIKREDFVRITTRPDTFLPAFHFFRNDKFFSLVLKFKLFEKK